MAAVEKIGDHCRRSVKKYDADNRNFKILDVMVSTSIDGQLCNSLKYGDFKSA